MVERLSKPTGLAVGTEDVVTLGLQAEADVDAVVHAVRAGRAHPGAHRLGATGPGVAYQPTVVTDAFEEAP